MAESGVPQSKLDTPRRGQKSISCSELESKATTSVPGYQEQEPVICGTLLTEGHCTPKWLACSAEAGESAKSSVRAGHFSGRGESLKLNLSPTIVTPQPRGDKGNPLI